MTRASAAPGSKSSIHLEWRSLAEREQKWAEFMADREWQEAKAKNEADGQIVANIVSSLLQPTRFYRGFSKLSE